MLNEHPVVRQSRQTLVIKFADQLELEKARSLSCLLPSGAVGHIPGTAWDKHIGVASFSDVGT